MPNQRDGQPGNILYTRDIGRRQALSIGLRACLPAMAFIALGAMVAGSGRSAPLALALGFVLWLPTMLAYLELAGIADESGIHDIIALNRSGMVAFLATLALMAADIAGAALLARAAGQLLLPFQSKLLPDLDTSVTVAALAAASLILGAGLALRRRQTWRRSDYLLLGIGLLAVLITVAGALMQKPSSAFPAQADSVSVFQAAIYPILALLALEAVSEWNGNLRRGRRGSFPWLAAIMMPLLFAGSLALLWAGLRLDPRAMAGQGLAGVIQHLPSGWQLASLLFVVALISAIGTLLLQANRLLRQLVREGYLPGAGVQQQKWGNVLFNVVVVALLAAFMLLLPEPTTAAVLTGFMLIYAGAINFTGVFYQPKKNGDARPRAFRLPFPPLVPALALVLVVFVGLTAALPTKLAVASFIALAALVYAAFGRKAHQRTDESKTVFGNKDQAGDAENHRYRILVPLVENNERGQALIDVATRLAETQNGLVMPLEVVELSPQQTRSEGARIARERNQLLRWSIGERRGTVPILPLTRIGHSVSQAIIDTARDENVELILISWNGRREGDNGQSAGVVGELVRGAPCVVAAVSGDLSHEIERILVPTAGGPNAPVAAGLALNLARPSGARVVGFNIVRYEGDREAKGRAENIVRNTFSGLESGEDVDVRIVQSDKSIASILLQEASQGYDLIMLGASNEGMLDNILFGNVPEQVAAEAPVPTIMVRAERPVSEAYFRLLWGRVQENAPVLNREDQIDLFRNLRRGARASINFYVLIVLSAIIATLGLWQNSAAVIIGAMLVAPLMTPILATSLGIVMGETRTIRVAAESTLKGVVLGIAIALFIALILPGEKVGSEILARTQPSLLDMAVALASGAAGAYALARREVSAALPGVAIAAALMPPLCTVGIGMALFSWAIAGGALLLFTTNLIAIIVAGTAVFLVLGMRPRDDQSRERNFRRGLVFAVVMLLVISVTLALPMLRQPTRVRETTSIESILATLLQEKDIEIVSVDSRQENGVTLVDVQISAPEGAVTAQMVDEWSRALATAQNTPVQLKVQVVPLVEFQSGSP